MNKLIQNTLSIIFSLLIFNSVYSQNIGIGSETFTPDPSAMLEVKSTDKGMLVPRVDIEDLSTAVPVTNPAVSLLVYNTNETTGVGFYYWDGTEWTPMGGSSGASACNYSLGLNNDLGGYVFYLTPNGCHGLVAATQDQSSITRWTIAQNIISNPENHNTAGKGLTDWRLPTIHELALMYTQKTEIGNFANTFYWSSTYRPEDHNDIQRLNFSNGTTSWAYGPHLEGRVRAVRSF